jgi:hypothetical protein
MKLITTKELIDSIINNTHKMVEARLLLKGGYATHFIYSTNKVLYDEGIDNEKRKISKEEFENYYTNCFWRLDNII